MENVKEDASQQSDCNLTGMKETLYVNKTEMIGAFQMLVIHAKPKTLFPRHNAQVINHALSEGDSSLPHGLKVQDTYMDMMDRGKTAAIMIWNSTAHPSQLKGAQDHLVRDSQFSAKLIDISRDGGSTGQEVRNRGTKDDEIGKGEAAL